MRRDPPFYSALDLIADCCSQSAGPDWKTEWRHRNRKTPQQLPSDRNMMRHFAVAIAYSQGARSSIVRQLVRDPVFEKAFVGFYPRLLARKNPNVILTNYWAVLSHIRFRSKVIQIVKCAKVLIEISHEFDGFSSYLKSFRIPRRLRLRKDIDIFWERFDHLQKDLHEREMPFFRSTTSLLQLLLDLDFDSVKPDLIVMRLARRIGIIECETGETQLRMAVRKIQEFSVLRKIRAPVIDLQILAFGGQTGSRELLENRFCPSSDPCINTDCPVGNSNFCKAMISPIGTI
ncbi:MAG TPA: hypothetical protein EYQ50_19145 [Verrucomicrobiales bacterium]|nr:hypothetical protein [Verrucomicrobiales bacterium]HIL69164.1 hypothetical protein [Verrucomicrobiota bacterium]